jgi:hypothetical protein
LQLVAYIGALDLNDLEGRNWIAGSSYVPPKFLFIDKFGGFGVIVTPPINGVISYEALSGVEGIFTIVSLAALAGKAAGTAFAQFQTQFALSLSLRF